jgi:hypothetical protein
MPRGERGTAKPYLRGNIWWVKYYVPGETQPRRESSGSTSKQDAVRLLNTRRKEIDDRKVSSSTATVNDLLKLYLDDQKRQKRHSYRSAEGFVRLHLGPAFGLIRAATLEPSTSRPSSSRSKPEGMRMPRSIVGLRLYAVHTR